MNMLEKLDRDMRAVGAKLEKITALQEEHNVQHAKERRLFEDLKKELRATGKHLDK